MAHWKYPSLENTYNRKSLRKFKDSFPGLRGTTLCSVDEKTDGSNIQLITKCNGDIQLGSRKLLLGGLDCPEFFGLSNVINTKYLDEVMILSDYAKFRKFDIWNYGEFFGRGIINRINYGPTKRIRFFNMAFKKDGMLLPPKEMTEVYKELGLEHMLIHHIGVMTLDEALEFDVEKYNTAYNDEPELAEGITIKPYKKTFKFVDGSTFLLKKKAERFSERIKQLKKDKPRKQIDEKLLELKSIAREYVTQNRLEGIYSKEGRRIEEMSEMKYFLIKMLEDIKEDFYKENDVKLTKADERVVFNLGGYIAPMLKEEFGK